MAKKGACFQCSGVVLASRDVAGAAGEINLKDCRILFLPFLPGQAAEVAADVPLAVIAHGMRRVVTQGGQRLTAVPETERLEPWIDQPFRRLCGSFIF